MHTVWPLGTIADDIDTHLALGGLDSRVGVAGRNGVALGVEQEVVDEGLHVLLHGGARGRGDLVVLDADGAGGHLVEALVDDAERLAELLHAAQVAVVAVAVDADGNVELDLVVGVVRLALADVPRHTGTAEHDACEGQVQSVGGRDHADAAQTVDPDTVVRKHLLGLVDAVAELSGPLVNIIEQAEREILVDTSGADVGGVETGTRDSLVEFLCF